MENFRKEINEEIKKEIILDDVVDIVKNERILRNTDIDSYTVYIDKDGGDFYTGIYYTKTLNLHPSFKVINTEILWGIVEKPQREKVVIEKIESPIIRGVLNWFILQGFTPLEGDFENTFQLKKITLVGCRKYTLYINIMLKNI